MRNSLIVTPSGLSTGVAAGGASVGVGVGGSVGSGEGALVGIEGVNVETWMEPLVSRRTRGKSNHEQGYQYPICELQSAFSHFSLVIV